METFLIYQVDQVEGFYAFVERLNFQSDIEVEKLAEPDLLNITPSQN